MGRRLTGRDNHLSLSQLHTIDDRGHLPLSTNRQPAPSIDTAHLKRCAFCQVGADASELVRLRLSKRVVCDANVAAVLVCTEVLW